jgi:hypothetical protein
MVEIHECIDWPQTSLQLFASNDFAPPIKQHGKDLKGLFLKPDLCSVAAEFPGPQIGLEDAELDHLHPVAAHRHRFPLFELVKSSRTSVFQARHLYS